MEQQDWKSWIGRQRHAADFIDANRANALRATLESADDPFTAGAALPPLWHWCYFWDVAEQSRLGSDGHAARGEFLPPIPLPRRMWAGSRLTWRGPLRIDARAERHSTIRAIETKQGRSGRLAFVTVAHAIHGPEGLAIEEEHDIVFREAPRESASKPKTQPAPRDHLWKRQIAPDPVLLFRYSALTFNGHRIHYDWPYATGTEGYPGLVVHGPLLATLMVELVRQNNPKPLKHFEFTALSPCFADAPFSVSAMPDDDQRTVVWVANHQGDLAMKGRAEFD